MSHSTRNSLFSVFAAIAIAVCFVFIPFNNISAHAAAAWVIMTPSAKTMAVGDTCSLTAVTSTGKKPTFSSSDSKVASVNTYGLVTAKKAGSCKITAKIRGAEASCRITVNETTVSLNKTVVSLNIGKTFSLTAKSSTGHAVTFRSEKSSIAKVSDKGVITAVKPGTTNILAKVDGVTAKCKVTVNTTRLTLSNYSKTLYRTNRIKLTATVSSGNKVTWKSNRSSVASVDSYGNVTAVKHGTAIITATADGVSKQCTITVKQPTIKLSSSTLSLKVGKSAKLTATVSSGVRPQWSSSNINVATVDSDGNITARQSGKAYIYAQEDGVKTSCIVTVSK